MKKKLIHRILLTLLFVSLIGISFVVEGQYYYFDTGSTNYPLQQGCAETVNVRINIESHPDGARAGLLRLLLDPLHFYYSTSAVASVLRTDLFVASASTFADRSSSSSPSWQDVGNTMIQIDRKNNTTDYMGNGGLYGTVKLVPLYSPTIYTGWISMMYIDGDTVKTSLSKVGGVNIINSGHQNSRLTGVYFVLQEPCVADTNIPNVSISVPVNGGTKQFFISGISLAMTDNASVGSVPYVWTGGGLWTGNIWSITNQYGIDLTTFALTISGNANSRTFVGSSFDTGNSSASKYAGPSCKSWQFLDKNYNVTIDFGELFDYGIEKPITITASVRDRKNNLFTLGSFVFNSPVGPLLLGTRSPNSGATFVDTAASVKLGIQDDRAGVNSGTIRVTLQGINGTTYGPYIFTGVALNLSGVTSIANQPNYYITISGHNIFPSSGTIQVIVYAQDMEGIVDTISDYSFTTRPSCAQLGCCNQISIQTGNNTPVLYDPSQIYISGGNNVIFSTGIDEGTGYVNCKVPWAGIPLYKGEGTNSGAAQYLNFFDRPVLYFSGASNIKIVLNGNTIYLSTIYVLPGGGGGGGGGGGPIVHPDDCLLPGSSLPGANLSGIDYSPSYYDDDCSGTGVHEAAPFCPVDYDDPDYTKEAMDAYQFCYSVGITDKCPISEAGLKNKLLRKDLVRMLVYFSVKVLGLTPDKQKQGCDVYGDLVIGSEDAAYAKLGCQLEVMGMEYDGVTPLKNFMPNDPVPRSQFGTTLSRIIFGRKYNGNVPYRYSKHLEALKKYGIMRIITSPNMIENRGFIMIMFKRAYDSGLVEQFRLAAAAKNGAIALK